MKLKQINSNVKIGEKGPFDLYELEGYDFSENIEFPIKKGVYVFTKRHANEDDAISHDILYVGQTTDLNSRFQGHHKAEELKKMKPNCLAIHKCDTDEELNYVEAALIDLWNPKLNDKHPKF